MEHTHDAEDEFHQRMWMCVSILECNQIHLKIDTERCHTVIKSSSYVAIRVHWYQYHITAQSSRFCICTNDVSLVLHILDSLHLYSSTLWSYMDISCHVLMCCVYSQVFRLLSSHVVNAMHDDDLMLHRRASDACVSWVCVWLCGCERFFFIR